MGNVDKIFEMRREDAFLYRTICEIVPHDEPTELVYDVFCKIHNQKSWKVVDIEREYERLKNNG